MLPNGVHIWEIASSGGTVGTDGIILDANGAEGSNTVGDDQLVLDICVVEPCLFNTNLGEAAYRNTAGSASARLAAYQSLFD